MRDAAADVVHHFADLAVDTGYGGSPARTPWRRPRRASWTRWGSSWRASGIEPIGRARSSTWSGDRRPARGVGTRLRRHACRRSSAAFANGAMAHCLDYDDQTPWGQHAASSIVPAVFAVAERRGGVSGRGDDHGGGRRARTSSPACAATSGGARTGTSHRSWGSSPAPLRRVSLLGLSREQTAHALGIASMQSCGTMEVVDGTGSDLRGIYAGFSAKGAVIAALLAREGRHRRARPSSRASTASSTPTSRASTTGGEAP